jgi:hypothetical protein
MPYTFYYVPSYVIKLIKDSVITLNLVLIRLLNSVHALLSGVCDHGGRNIVSDVGIYKPQMHQILTCLFTSPDILLYNHNRWCFKDKINLLQGPVLSLWHEQQLIEAFEDRDTAVDGSK